MTAREPPCRPVCRLSGQGGGNTRGRGFGRNWGGFRQERDRPVKAGISADTTGSKIKQEKGPGLLMLPLPGAQRTAMPTASGIPAFERIAGIRGRKSAPKTAAGVEYSENAGVTGTCQGFWPVLYGFCKWRVKCLKIKRNSRYGRVRKRWIR